MPILNVEGVTHWSIPVHDLEEAEELLWGVAGTGPGGTIREQHHVRASTLETTTSCCASVPIRWTGRCKEDAGVHHSFTVSPETFELRCKVFHERNVAIDHLTYRAGGVFTGRELYFFDPSGNRLELRGRRPGPRACPSRRLKNWPAHRPGQA